MLKTVFGGSRMGASGREFQMEGMANECALSANFDLVFGMM